MTEYGRYLETEYNSSTDEICIVIETDEYKIKTVLEHKELDDLIKVLRLFGKI